MKAGEEWKSSAFLPKTEATIAAIKSGDVLLKSPEDMMAEEIERLQARVTVLEEALSAALRHFEFCNRMGVVPEAHFPGWEEALGPTQGERSL